MDDIQVGDKLLLNNVMSYTVVAVTPATVIVNPEYKAPHVLMVIKRSSIDGDVVVHVPRTEAVKSK